MVLLRGTLPSGLANATSDFVPKQPHLSPQHYELNAKQHVLNQEYWLAGDKQGQDANKLVGSRCADLTAPRRSDPSLLKGTQPTTFHMEGWARLIS